MNGLERACPVNGLAPAGLHGVRVHGVTPWLAIDSVCVAQAETPGWAGCQRLVWLGGAHEWEAGACLD